MRVSEEQRDVIDAWREAQPDKPSRSEAIRRLVEQSLKGRSDRADTNIDPKVI